MGQVHPMESNSIVPLRYRIPAELFAVIESLQGLPDTLPAQLLGITVLVAAVASRGCDSAVIAPLKCNLFVL